MQARTRASLSGFPVGVRYRNHLPLGRRERPCSSSPTNRKLAEEATSAEAISVCVSSCSSRSIPSPALRPRDYRVGALPICEPSVRQAKQLKLHHKWEHHRHGEMLPEVVCDRLELGVFAVHVWLFSIVTKMRPGQERPCVEFSPVAPSGPHRSGWRTLRHADTFPVEVLDSWRNQSPTREIAKGTSVHSHRFPYGAWSCNAVQLQP